MYRIDGWSQKNNFSVGVEETFNTQSWTNSGPWIAEVYFGFEPDPAGVRSLVACVAGASNIARFGKFVPVVGGVVAGGFDAAVTQLIGRTADRVFTSTMAKP